jgi:broad specificity phosphatase PhoE
LYPVLALQPRQFLEARRSLANYLQDIAAGVISYRCHDFGPDGRRERLERLPLDARHQGEYAYHIVRNLVTNYAKLVLRKNTQLAEPMLLEFWRDFLPSCASFIDWFAAVSAIKRMRGQTFPPETVIRTREFLMTFAETLQDTLGARAIRHQFVRHSRTVLNDGTFLGQHRDPPIIEVPPPLLAAPIRALTSPALRCRMTAAGLAPSVMLEIDPHLSEINYGTAEGLTFRQLSELHPELVEAWSRGEDPCFPGGENTADVMARLQSVIAGLGSLPALVVTHNVVMRCLLGDGLDLPKYLWHLIPVGHLETVSLIRLGERTYLDLTAEQVAGITDALVAHSP